MGSKSQAWTNQSVLRFSSGEDPVAKISRVAREVVMDAMERGWEGPPFDPTELAAIRGIDTAPCDDVRDARISGSRGSFKIEYNPSRPPRRVRYSIAHEIAHTLFDDCEDEVRHRDRVERGLGDEWQLEALCNIAAAELLMPVGSLPDLGATRFNIDEIARLRDTFHVATEAMAIRLTQITTQSCAMFCASRPSAESDDVQIDYTIGSRAWGHPEARRRTLGEGSVASHCTSVDFTWTGTERWGADWPLVEVSAIGIPPYPGSRFPRVVGIATPVESEETAPRLSYVHGDATDPRGSGPKLLAHVVHDATPRWGGGGFAQAIARRWPDAQKDFRSWAKENDLRSSFGEVRFFEVSDDVTVASMVCQRGYRFTGRPLVRYSALQHCLDAVAGHALEGGMSVHMPRIGTGAAAGRWSVVEELIEEALSSRGISTTVYDLPGSTQRVDPQLSLALGLM